MKYRVFALSLALALLFSGCTGAPAEHSDSFRAMDTFMELTAYGKDGAAAVESAKTYIRQLDSLFSVTSEGSEIVRANRGERVELSPETAELLDDALGVCADTGGALDVTVYPAVRAWGFTTGEYRVPDEKTLSALLEKVDFRQVQAEGGILSLPDGVELDLGAVAKGYAGDRVMEIFREYGVASAKIALGGNVQVLGRKPDGSLWRIGIQDPERADYAGVVEVEDKAVVTSGGYERYFERDGVRYWHILNPDTGMPARTGLLSVTVVSPSGALADCLSTALFVMGPERAAEYWRAHSDEFDFVLLGEDGTVTITEGLKDSFSPHGAYTGADLKVITTS